MTVTTVDGRLRDGGRWTVAPSTVAHAVVNERPPWIERGVVDRSPYDVTVTP